MAGARPPWKPKSLLLPTATSFLRLQAQRLGDERGIVYEDRLWPYSAIADLAEELAAFLRAAGCADHARVAFRVANSPLAVACHYAAWTLGGVAVPIGIRTTPEEMREALERTMAQALVLDDVSVAALESVWRELEAPVVAAGSVPGAAVRIMHRSRASGSRGSQGSRQAPAAVLASTSGTTGTPKTVMLSHANLFWSALACSSARGDNGTEIGAAISLLSHTPVFVSHVLCRILFGATVVMFPRFDLEEILWAAARYGITDLTLIGGMVADVVARGRVPAPVEERVRKVSVGGAFTPMDAKSSLREIFPRAEIIEAYGQSEATDGVTMARGGEVFDRPGTIGRQNPHVIVRIRKSDGSWAAPGEEGEIVIGGPTVMLGYWRNRRATHQVLRDGWLHSGDLGRGDEDGFFYITGRIKNLIITGGENVSPVEVETVLRRHPAVAEVAVIGTPHPKWGEQVTAVIVPRPGATPSAEDIAEFAGRHLAGFKKPRRVEFVASLPRNAANKVDLATLKSWFVSPGTAATLTKGG
ncbi:MAG: fatty-acid--CoA ligase [Candidatus Binatia bacterium]|nr:MAG: fatty-acid--CoA ligase [Candidatus Binatia bacterium]